jgi:hypothetical protein
MSRRMNSLALIAILCTALLGGETQKVPEAVAGDASQTCPFAFAEFVPQDVTLYLHINGAAGVRDELSSRPIGAWLNAAAGSGQAGRAWHRLAEHAGVNAERLFDMCFGRRMTLIARSQGDETAQWVVLTEIDPHRSARLLTRLKARAMPPRAGHSVWEIPEHDVVLAQRGSEMLIGPRSAPGLFTHLLETRKGGVHGDSLAALPAIEKARTSGNSHLGLFVRHEPPMGGWSVAAARLDGDRVRVRHFGRFDHPPFGRPVSEIEIDTSPLEAFAEHALIAFMEPTDIGHSQFETFLSAVLGRGLLSAAMQRNICERRIFVVGEVTGEPPRPRGDDLDGAHDLQAPTLALCIELRDGTNAEKQLDHHMLDLARRIHDLGNGRYTIDVPAEPNFDNPRGRTIDISPAADWLTGGLPLVKPMSLNWTVVRSEGGGVWCVVATHPYQLRDAVRALQRPDAPTLRAGNPDPENRSTVHTRGIINGPRIGHHLRSWAERPELLAEPGRANDLRQTLHLMSDFAIGIERAQWSIHRPSREEMILDITITLTPAPSGR